MIAMQKAAGLSVGPSTGEASTPESESGILGVSVTLEAAQPLQSPWEAKPSNPLSRWKSFGRGDLRLPERTTVVVLGISRQLWCLRPESKARQGSLEVHVISLATRDKRARRKLPEAPPAPPKNCLLYTSDAADE